MWMCIPRRRRTANNERCCNNKRSVLQLCTAGGVRAERRLYPCTGRVPHGAAGGGRPHQQRAGSRIAPLANRAQLRPLVYIASIAVVCVLEHAVLWLAKGLPHRSALLRIVPLAGLNSCVLGTVLVERTQSFTLGQSLGFGLGSGLGYVLAVLLVTEARHRLRSKAIPEAFRGLPITLVYIGVLALAIYGFTGHSVIL